MNRITITLDKLGLIERICADEAVEVYVVSPPPSIDRVYLMSTVEVGQHRVDRELGGHPIGSQGAFPSEQARRIFAERMKAIRALRAAAGC